METNLILKNALKEIAFCIEELDQEPASKLKATVCAYSAKTLLEIAIEQIYGDDSQATESQAQEEQLSFIDQLTTEKDLEK